MMKFVNFVNEQTYLFFEWIRESGQADKLVAEALDQVEGDEGFAMGQDVSTTAKDLLSDFLAGQVEALNDLIFVELSLPEGPLSVDRNLCIQLLEVVLRAIRCDAVAEALLIAVGKWAPDREVRNFF
jgi:hypothetical protein